jgi:hypothetical protein
MYLIAGTNSKIACVLIAMGCTTVTEISMQIAARLYNPIEIQWLFPCRCISNEGKVIVDVNYARKNSIIPFQ